MGLLLSVAGTGGAQERLASREVEAYFRAVGHHFRVPVTEVKVLSAWDLPADHVAVVLFLARRTGVSPDALVSRHRSGDSWAEVGRGLGLDAGDFHVPLPEGAALGPLAAAYRRFASTPPSGWSAVELSDPDVVALVNIRFIGAELGVPPLRVLEVAAGAGSFVTAYRVLHRR